MTTDEARALRADIFDVLFYAAAHTDARMQHRRANRARPYRRLPRRRTLLRIVLESLPRVGHGEIMTEAHVTNLETVAELVVRAMRRRPQPLTADERSRAIIVDTESPDALTAVVGTLRGS